MGRPMLMAGLAAAAVLGAALVAGACGGDGGGLEEYFDEVQTLDDGFRESTEVLDEEAEGVLARLSSGEVDAAVGAAELAELFRRQGASFQAYAADLVGLEAPEEAAEAHLGAIQGLAALSGSLGVVADQLEEVRSFEELLAVLEGMEALLAPAEDLAGPACLELEAIAAASDLSLDLDCPE